VSWPAAASAFVVLSTGCPAPGALVCDPQSPRELVAQADVVFTGKVTALVQDRDTVQAPPPILKPVLRFWPRQVPVPTIPTLAPGPGVPAARFQVEAAYKGAVSPQMTVRLLGIDRRFRTGETWTIFAASRQGHLLTTECSGNQSTQIDPAAYGLVAHRPTPATDKAPPQLYWALGLLALLALGGAGGAALLTADRRRRPAPADLKPR